MKKLLLFLLTLVVTASVGAMIQLDNAASHPLISRSCTACPGTKWSESEKYQSERHYRMHMAEDLLRNGMFDLALPDVERYQHDESAPGNEQSGRDLAKIHELIKRIKEAQLASTDTAAITTGVPIKKLPKKVSK